MVKDPVENISPFQMLWKKISLNGYKNEEKQVDSIARFQKIIERLNEIGKGIITKYSVESIVQTVYQNINQLMDAQVFAIGVQNEHLNGLEFWGLKNGKESIQLGFESLTEHECWSIHCFNDQKEIFVRDGSMPQDYKFSKVLFSENDKPRLSFIYLPLTFQRKRKGVICVQSFKKDAYSNLHLIILRNLASFIAIALENADNYYEIQLQKEAILAKTNELEEVNLFLEYKVKGRTWEIEQQSKRLVETNKKLEMLSIVATQTNNAIMIMDEDGDILWINDCFTKLYGYKLNDFIAARGCNIRQTSFNPNIKEQIEECLNNKKPVYYEAVNVMQTGESIWTETTLTPIFDDEGEVINLVTIDTDITRHKNYENHILKLQDAEREIAAQAEVLSNANAVLEETQSELLDQKEELIEVNRTLHESNNKISRQNEYINGSIRYAKNIQEAILPLPERLDKYVDWSVIYLPKDTVSGDFYWFARLGSTEQFILATIDCTGHGVSGAFMSMVAERLLNEVVKINDVHDPAEILEGLDVGLKKALKQDKNFNNDGMDISLCLFNRLPNNKTKVVFAGARTKLFFYKMAEKGTTILKGSSKHIGGHFVVKPNEKFENQEFILDKGDLIVMYTDGIIDQNNMDRKRFGSSKMIKTIENNIDLTVSSIRDQLLTELNIHKEGCEQRDDITVFFARM